MYMYIYVYIIMQNNNQTILNICIFSSMILATRSFCTTVADFPTGQAF